MLLKLIVLRISLPMDDIGQEDNISHSELCSDVGKEIQIAEKILLNAPETTNELDRVEFSPKIKNNDISNILSIVQPEMKERMPLSVDKENSVSSEQSMGGQVTIVKVGQQLYTKITPASNQQSSKLSQSPGSAFTATNSKTTDNRNMLLKADPSLQHLLPQFKAKSKGSGSDSGKPIKAPLLRSTSMPVCVESDLSEDVDACGKSNQVEQGRFFHRTIYRTGSVSDYTKQKLKKSILMRTSASLVRKPSITEQEMRHIQADADSSQSDDDEEELDDDASAQFKPVNKSSDDHEKSMETTAALSCGGDNSCREEVTETQSSLSSAGPNVSLVIAMTTT